MIRTTASIERRERAFFLIMALAIAMTVIAGFGLFHLAGFSSFEAPWWVHVHAVSSMIWVGIYVSQNALIFRNNLRLHRSLGWFAACFAIWMVLTGLALGYAGVAAGRIPPIFTPASLLALNWVNILTFGALVLAAIINRRRTDWHRRLMLCAMICVMAPAFGRLLILAGARTHLNFTLVILGWVVAAMIFDFATRKRVHPAYLWGFGAIVLMGLSIGLLPSFPPFESFANAVAN